MGKIRVKTIGLEEEEQEQKQKAESKKKKVKDTERSRSVEKKAASKASRPAGSESDRREPVEDLTHSEERTEASTVSVNSAKQSPTTNEQITDKQNSERKPAANSQKAAAQTTRSNNYRKKAALIDKKKHYSIKDALDLLPQIHLAEFDETVELHINTTEPSVSGNVVLPHGTGKKTRIAVANDEIIKDIEAGKIEFDILLAEPQFMPKLAKVARVLGPKGLMPNPKNGTVTAKPEEAAKKFEAGQVNFKTETKNPILHVIIGKMSFKPAALQENYTAMIQAVGRQKIRDITLKSTMSPGIRVQV